MKKIRNEFVLRDDFRPMLAAKVDDVSLIEMPVLATPKIDGIRGVTREKHILDLFAKTNVEVVSRFLKPIPNDHIQRTLASYDIPGLDGEIVTYTPGINGEDTVDGYNDVQSKVMSVMGTPNFFFHVFDLVEPTPHWDRVMWLKDQMYFPEGCRIKKILPTVIETHEQLLAYEQACLLQGFEGVMTRTLNGPYKFGRATKKQQWLLKIKRFLDADATIIDFEELMVNTNEQTENELGLAERSDHKAGKVPGNTLGSLVVVGSEDRHRNVEFRIGSGFDDATRKYIWEHKDDFRFKTCKYKYQPHGEKDKPRCPIYLGMRED